MWGIQVYGCPDFIHSWNRLIPIRQERIQWYRVTDTLRLEDTTGDHPIQHCCSSRTGCLLNISKDGDSTHSISHCSFKQKTSKRQASWNLLQFLTIIDCIELVQKGRKCLIFIFPILFAILHRIVNSECYQHVCVLRNLPFVLERLLSHNSFKRTKQDKKYLFKTELYLIWFVLFYFIVFFQKG